MVNCWAVKCTNRSEAVLQFFWFPRDSSLKKIWVQNVSRLDASSNPRAPKLLEPGSATVICEKHFEEHWFTLTKTEKRHLKPGAIPTVFAHKRPHPQTERAKRHKAIEGRHQSSSSHAAHAVALPTTSCLDFYESGSVGQFGLLHDTGDSEVDQLKHKVNDLQKRLNQAQKEKRAGEAKLRQHKIKMHMLFNKDQLSALSRRSTPRSCLGAGDC
ncbi:THAP domain-containing protein 6-like [Watersipora subatra]|uniref:THAP domain-containing protein 6-like n=1 Tax=Watersipora subatra TaxID=2589382 RepID=UPI00355B4EBB